VTAAIRLVDELPKLKQHLTADILPILATLDRVGPDLHDLLDVTRDLKLAVAGIPGLGMLRRRCAAGDAPRVRQARVSRPAGVGSSLSAGRAAPRRRAGRTQAAPAAVAQRTASTLSALAPGPPPGRR
jgi:hypothetical protein